MINADALAFIVDGMVQGVQRYVNINVIFVVKGGHYLILMYVMCMHDCGGYRVKGDHTSAF